MITPAYRIDLDHSLRVSIVFQLVPSVLGLITNGIIIVRLTFRPRTRTQPNFLVANLSCANFLICLTFGIWACLNLVYEMIPSISTCMYIMAPSLFALNVSLCCSVAVVHHRSTCYLSGYSSIHGLATITERWKLIAASISVWLLTFLAGAAAYLDVGSEGAVPICIYPVALQNSYLVPFAMFTCCVVGVIIIEHLRVLSFLIYGLLWKESSEKPNVAIFRSSIILFLLFIACWTPLNYVSYLYLNPSATVYQVHYYKLAQWLCTLPLIHASLVDPFAYALCEREYLDSIISALLILCPPDFRWRLKWRLKRLYPLKLNRSNPENERSNCALIDLSSGNMPFAISTNGMQNNEAIRHDKGGHVNFGYRTEYI